MQFTLSKKFYSAAIFGKTLYKVTSNGFLGAYFHWICWISFIWFKTCDKQHFMTEIYRYNYATIAENNTLVKNIHIAKAMCAEDNLKNIEEMLKIVELFKVIIQSLKPYISLKMCCHGENILENSTDQQEVIRLWGEIWFWKSVTKKLKWIS